MVTLAMQSAAVVMLVVDGIWAGVIFTFAVERVSLWRRMPIAQYAVDFRRSLARVDPLQPILGVIAVIAAVVFALSASGSAAVWCWNGIALVVFVIIMSIALPERINSQFRRRPEGDVPPDAEALRTRWRGLHYTRTVPAIGSIVAFAIAVVA